MLNWWPTKQEKLLFLQYTLGTNNNASEQLTCLPPSIFCIRNGSISFWQAESSWQKQTTVFMLLCYTVMASMSTLREPPLDLNRKLSTYTKCSDNIIFWWKIATNKNNKAIYRTLQKEQREFRIQLVLSLHKITKRLQHQRKSQIHKHAHKQESILYEDT